MSHAESNGTDRRTFLKTGALASASALSMAGGIQAQDAAQKAEPIPRRKLGKTGVEITLLDQGAVRGASVDRLIRLSFASGVRTFDTAKVYRTEPNFRKWFEQDPEVRKQIFLITKDMPRSPDQIPKMVDDRLKTLDIDQIDLFFIHGLGDEHRKLEDAVNLVTSKEFGKVADAVRSSGKVRFIGFSSHHKDRATLIQKAAEAGIIDAVMMQYRPWLDKESPLNKALDVAWKKGVGLISMKQIAGFMFGDRPQGNILDDVVRKVPMLKERNLTPFQGLLHAIWTDERISSVCVSMRNSDEMRLNVDAARRFEPLKTAQIEQLRDAVLGHGLTLCADCDGRCSLAAGTQAELGNLTRFLTYHEHLGNRAEARHEYAKLPPEARDWSGADLEAARAACPNQLDFAKLLPKVDQYLA